MAGAVRVAGRPLRRPGFPVEAGLRLEVRLRQSALAALPVPRKPPALRVLFEDELLIAVDKPPGIPTQPTVDPGRLSLFGVVKELLAGRAGAAVYLGLHQRLDRDTSGVVLFTKAPRANPALAALFAERRVEKTYLALAARPPRLPPASWSVEARLEPGERGARPRVVAAGGVEARTDFRLLETFSRGLLIEARPRTGRKHQIRVHLAAGGMPILGDRLHGGPVVGDAAPRPMLHASRLAFPHPASGAPVVIDSPPPADWRRGLRALRSGAGPERG